MWRDKVDCAAIPDASTDTKGWIVCIGSFIGSFMLHRYNSDCCEVAEPLWVSSQKGSSPRYACINKRTQNAVFRLLPVYFELVFTTLPFASI